MSRWSITCKHVYYWVRELQENNNIGVLCRPVHSNPVESLFKPYRDKCSNVELRIPQVFMIWLLTNVYK